MTLDLPLVSIIIPVYNGERFLAETLDSVVAQDYSNIEIIVIDDGSTDGSTKIINGYAGVTYVQQANQGNASARNLGITKSNGQYISFLDQDDVLQVSKISKQVAALQQNVLADYSVVHRKHFLTPGESAPAWFNQKLLEDDYVSYCPGALMVRKTAFTTLGMFDTDLKTTSDVQWFVNAKEKKAKSTIVAEPLLLKRVHQQAQSATPKLNQELLSLLKAKIKKQRTNHE